MPEGQERSKFLSRPTAALLLIDLAGFALLTLAVADLRGVSAWDHAANAAFAPYRSGAALTAFLWITNLGTGGCLIAVLTTATALLWACGRAALIPPYWAVYLGTEATVWSVKFALGRARPDFIAAVSAVSPSFPSAHAAGALAVYGFLAWLTARAADDRRARAAIGAFAGALTATIAFSRIFLSVHFVTDVLGGILVAAFWIIVGAALAAKAERDRPV